MWYTEQFHGDGPQPKDRPWVEHPRLIEDEYTVIDAVVVGTLLNSLLRHGDRVTVACQAQLVNVIGLIRSEEGGEPGGRPSPTRSSRCGDWPPARSSSWWRAVIASTHRTTPTYQ